MKYTDAELPYGLRGTEFARGFEERDDSHGHANSCKQTGQHCYCVKYPHYKHMAGYDSSLVSWSAANLGHHPEDLANEFADVLYEGDVRKTSCASGQVDTPTKHSACTADKDCCLFHGEWNGKEETSMCSRMGGKEVYQIFRANSS